MNEIMKDNANLMLDDEFVSRAEAVSGRPFDGETACHLLYAGLVALEGIKAELDAELATEQPRSRRRPRKLH